MKIEIDKGMNLIGAIREGKSVCVFGYEWVEFVFNDIELVVYKDSRIADIAEIYRLKCKCGEYVK